MKFGYAYDCLFLRKETLSNQMGGWLLQAMRLECLLRAVCLVLPVLAAGYQTCGTCLAISGASCVIDLAVLCWGFLAADSSAVHQE